MSKRNRPDPEKLASFLTESKSADEVIARFSLNKKQAGNIHGLPMPKSVAIFEVADERGMKYYRAVPQVQSKAAKDRDWALWQGDQNLPYILVQFPDGLSLKRMKVVPISDVHYGAKSHLKDKFLRYLKWIEHTDEVYAFLNGDIVENAVEGSIGSAIYDSILNPSEQIWGSRSRGEPGMIELLQPIAHKIFWAQPGNHEARSRKVDIDPLRIICHDLGIPYFNEPVYADVLAWGHRFKFFCQHGRSGSGTKGGKINAASRPAEWQEPLHFVVMGHVHDSMATSQTRIKRLRKYDESGRVIERRLLEWTENIVVCPAFYGYYGSYGARAVYEPGSQGMVTCLLYPDGEYRLSDG